MTLAIVATRAGVGLEVPAVHVEVHLANGLPGLTLVGLQRFIALAGLPLKTASARPLIRD